MAVNRLEERGFAAIQAKTDGSRTKVLILTAKGRHARDTYYQLVWELEKRWETNFGQVVINLRRSLEYLARESPTGKFGLFGGLKPYPDGWRASVGRPEVLPHYPMILHRGGFPDGS